MKSLMKKTILRSSWAFALLAGLLAPGTAMALRDGVVIDVDGGAAYVMSPQGGIDALDLATGNVIWKSTAAAKPLLVKGGTLVAQGRSGRSGELVIVALDAKRGAARERVDVEIPAALRAQVADGPSRTFRVQAFSAADSVIVTWTAGDRYPVQGALLVPEPAGAPPTDNPSNKRAAAQPMSGAARLDLTAGRAVAMPYEQAQELRTSAVAEKAGRQVDGPRQLTSLDGRYTLHSERSGEDKLWAPYRWTVTDAAGRTVGTVDAPVSMAPFVVAGSRILYVAQPVVRVEGKKMIEEPLRLRALDLKTGAEMWTAVVTDTAYRGPSPP
jgi:PQQ-like domain